MTILDTYQREHARSATLHRQALEVFPDGVTHDTRRFTPFPLYVDRALGAYKWDVDGHQIIDYVSGHGSLLLGHSHPDVVAALHLQVDKGTHLGASHEHEIEWGQWVQKLMPCAEKVRFTSSGTEAVHMAVRLARAHTGRDLLIKFEQHFHGWSDTVSAQLSGVEGLLHGVGIPEGTLGTQVILPANDAAALERTVAEHKGEVAAIILEPTGASMGSIPIDPEFLFTLREITSREGIVLIFDEVVTGFRVSPGGAQAYYSVTPDLCTMAKVLAGGLPGGAVAGRAEIMNQIEFSNEDGTARAQRIAHPGTYNANPLSAVAGKTALALAATGEPHRLANAAAARLAREMNGLLARHEVLGCVYGQQSLLHILLGKEATRPEDGYGYVWPSSEHRRVPQTEPALVTSFRQSMINAGVDPMGPRLIVGASHHDDGVISATLDAFDRTLTLLKQEGLL